MYRGFSHTMAGRKRHLSGADTNEDRVLVRPLDSFETGPGILAAVADGVSNCADGGAVAEWLIHGRLGKDDLQLGPETDPARLIGTYLRKVHDDFLDRFESDPEMMESACTLAGVLARGRKACVFWCGDSPIHLLRKTDSGFEGQTLSIPDKIEGTPMLTDCFCGLTAFAFRSRSIELAPGDLLVCATDGLVPGARDLALSAARDLVNHDWVERLCADSQAIPASDDVGMAVIQFG